MRAPAAALARAAGWASLALGVAGLVAPAGVTWMFEMGERPTAGRLTEEALYIAAHLKTVGALPEALQVER